MSITVNCLQLYQRYTEKPSRPGGLAMSGDDLREVEAKVGPILAELEALRQETLRKIDGRVIWMVPGGVAAGFMLSRYMSDASWLAALNYCLIGGVLGWLVAFTSLNNSYRSAYKGRIIPHLAGRFGELGYRPAREPDLTRLATLGILPQFGKKCVEDEIFGAYRGVRLNIVEASLETGGKHSRVVFNGLLLEMLLPHGPAGTTLVVKDRGMLGNAIGVSGPRGLERVRLEDPRFEDRYQIYSDDQIAARALLTPAVMERLLAFEPADGGDPPRLLAENGILRVAVAKGLKDNLFEPPSIANPVSGGDQLLQLSADIGSALKLIDAVLAIAPQTIRPDALAPPSVKRAP